MAAVPLFVLQNNARVVKKRRAVLEQLSDFEIRKNCGLDYHGVTDILNIFEPLEGKKKFAIPLETKVITFLSYLRSGDFQWSLGTLGGTSQSSVSRIIENCTSRVLEIAGEHINFPLDVDSRRHSISGFASLCSSTGFPSVLGVVDGTHVGITAPPQDEELYVNRKHYHSINCQVVASSDQRFLDIVAKWPGKTHDALIWRESSVKRRLDRGELGAGWFLGKQQIRGR